MYTQALFDQFNIQADTEEAKKTRIENADVLGLEGYRLQKDTSQRPYEGSTLKVYYGDNVEGEVEVLHNVWILGRAKPSIENSPRVGAEPVMEFYSFIASRVGR